MYKYHGVGCMLVNGRPELGCTCPKEEPKNPMTELVPNKIPNSPTKKNDFVYLHVVALGLICWLGIHLYGLSYKETAHTKTPVSFPVVYDHQSVTDVPFTAPYTAPETVSDAGATHVAKPTKATPKPSSARQSVVPFKEGYRPVYNKAETKCVCAAGDPLCGCM